MLLGASVQPAWPRSGSTGKNLRVAVAGAAILVLSLLSGYCSLHNAVNQGDDRYMRGSAAREYLREGLVVPAIYDGRDATSSALSASDRSYFQEQFLVDLILADMVSIDDAAFYRAKDVRECATRLSNSARFVDSRLGLFLCDLESVSPI